MAIGPSQQESCKVMSEFVFIYATCNTGYDDRRLRKQLGQ